MNKKITAIGLSAGLLAGLGAGLALEMSGNAGASNGRSVMVGSNRNGDDAQGMPGGFGQNLQDILKPLVDDGTLTQAQSDAIAAADRFIKLHPNHPNVDYAYYLKGIVWFNEDQGILAKFADMDPTERDPKAARDSFDAFRELVQRYPDSKYAPDGLQRMNWLVNALASHEVHVARYYLLRGANVAAVNRAQYEIGRAHV